MRKINIFFSCLFLSFQLIAQDTFSIVAVDPATGEVGAAGASCVDGAASIGGVIILNKILPGRGGINAQAWICVNPHTNLNNAANQMFFGKSPEQIIEWLQENDQCSVQNFNPAYRQYGIVDFDSDGNPRSAAFTGESADDYKGHLIGDNYAIQGNILLGPEVLEGMENGFTQTEGTLAEKLMAAMQGANFAGADARCLDRGTSSTSAFLRVMRPDDDDNDPYLELNVAEMPFGEEPIDSLQILYDEWALTNSTNDLTTSIEVNIYPNPTNDLINIQFKNSDSFAINQIQFYNLNGQLLHQKAIESSSMQINNAVFAGNQIILYQIRNKEKAIVATGKIILKL